MDIFWNHTFRTGVCLDKVKSLSTHSRDLLKLKTEHLLNGQMSVGAIFTLYTWSLLHLSTDGAN